MKPFLNLSGGGKYGNNTEFWKMRSLHSWSPFPQPQTHTKKISCSKKSCEIFLFCASAWKHCSHRANCVFSLMNLHPHRINRKSFGQNWVLHFHIKYHIRKKYMPWSSIKHGNFSRKTTCVHHLQHCRISQLFYDVYTYFFVKKCSSVLPSSWDQWFPDAYEVLLLPPAKP